MNEEDRKDLMLALAQIGRTLGELSALSAKQSMAIRGLAQAIVLTCDDKPLLVIEARKALLLAESTFSVLENMYPAGDEASDEPR
ncbi:hypothetical protein [Pseudomonas sp. NBRC 100443]|uniref:hypothetical protein n=1 Tax=Pseudomonas sp. NBRC 100443 TaxID=1113665 RepID=UPI00249FAFA6|nr:hypothetical protein [Pseudomonas sp. NBRC 100443]GLU38854.1 hypothetical protein Pssp01_29470 [Pseudomonas sp. NBRC 100443]